MERISKNILSWCENLEEAALLQAKNISVHPFLIGNVCLMPDCHAGYGMPIGGVVALDRAVCPNMVGVDIGCGMMAVKTNIKEKPDRNCVEKIINSIYETVPVGKKWHSEKQDYFPHIKDNMSVTMTEYENLKYELGTLGGGNHFIEIQWGSDGHLWYMIHSGSRNLGKKVADYYNTIAKKLCERWKYNDLIKNDLAVIPYDDCAFEDYFDEMNFCLDFATENRYRISNSVFESIKSYIPDAKTEKIFSIHHNYCAIEHHYGKNVFIHRKGATLARFGITGIIPGSQGTASYIVNGLGNPAAMHSCSHGAGRCMSRTQAKEKLSVITEAEFMNKKGIVHRINNIDDLDESPSAYKNIDEVMEQQKDLVEIVTRLEPIGVVKG